MSTTPEDIKPQKAAGLDVMNPKFVLNQGTKAIQWFFFFWCLSIQDVGDHHGSAYLIECCTEQANGQCIKPDAEIFEPRYSLSFNRINCSSLYSFSLCGLDILVCTSLLLLAFPSFSHSLKDFVVTNLICPRGFDNASI